MTRGVISGEIAHANLAIIKSILLKGYAFAKTLGFTGTLDEYMKIAAADMDTLWTDPETKEKKFIRLGDDPSIKDFTSEMKNYPTLIENMALALRGTHDLAKSLSLHQSLQDHIKTSLTNRMPAEKIDLASQEIVNEINAAVARIKERGSA